MPGTWNRAPQAGQRPTRPGAAPAAFSRLPQAQTKTVTGLPGSFNFAPFDHRPSWRGALSDRPRRARRPYDDRRRGRSVRRGPPGRGGAERIQEGDDRLAFRRGEFLEPGGDVTGLAAVELDRLLERRGAAVVEVGGRVGHAPKRRGPPLRGGRLLARGELLVRHVRRRDDRTVIAGARLELDPHVV